MEHDSRLDGYQRHLKRRDSRRSKVTMECVSPMR